MRHLLMLSSLALIALSACGSKAAPAADDAAAPAADDSAAPAAAADSGGEKKGHFALPEEEANALESVARQALTAYRDKNLEALAAVGPPGAKDKLIFLEPRNPHYEELLGDDTWRMKSLKAWDGQTLIKTEAGIDVAFAYYYQDADWRYAVELRKDPDPAKNNELRWMFHDLVQKPAK